MNRLLRVCELLQCETAWAWVCHKVQTTLTLDWYMLQHKTAFIKNEWYSFKHAYLLIAVRRIRRWRHLKHRTQGKYSSYSDQQRPNYLWWARWCLINPAAAHVAHKPSISSRLFVSACPSLLGSRYIILVVSGQPDPTGLPPLGPVTRQSLKLRRSHATLLHGHIKLIFV